VVVAAERADERGDDVGALRAAIHDAVFSATRILADDIVLLPRNSLPLTSSGKVMRPEARRLYLGGHWRDR
jgi:acyl-coenzyme A synthetase/AMP-(fatty) acid ligase